MKIVGSLMIAALVLILFSAEASAQNEKQDILRKCSSIFGQPIDAKLDLFEFDQLFVVHPEFAADGALVKISVEPKYFFEKDHPEWTEPDKRPHLSKIAYDRVLSKINAIQPLGTFLRKNSISAVTNSTSHGIEFYENADLRFGESFPYGTKENVRFVQISFFHTVEGKITGKKTSKFAQTSKFFNTRPYLVSVGEALYYVEESTYKILSKGKIAIFRGILAPDYIN